MRKTLEYLLAIMLVLNCASAGAGVPDALNYQGYLTDPGGSAIDGNVSIVFSIYSAESGGGMPLWSIAETVSVDQGLLSVELGGSGTPFPAGMFESPLWLGIKVGDDAEMIPRRPLTTVGFSFTADNAVKLEGQGAATYDQSAHVADTANPHAVTAAQVGVERQSVLAATAVDTTTFKSVIVQCPDGKVSLGGGGRITFSPGSGSVGQAIVNSYPNTETSWSVSARSPVTTATGWQLIGYAVCGRL